MYRVVNKNPKPLQLLDIHNVIKYEPSFRII